ncbi:MAG TPA: hypothetical protein H9671_10595 [Firmicutes bacterium]|nr:hypothetical protein [Bacillota bacterium]
MANEFYQLFVQCLEIPYTTVENAGSFAVRKEGGHLMLFFEKSNGLTDWKNNLNFPCIPYHHMGKLWFCHRGFLKVWKSIKPYLYDVIRDPTVQEITITGYSHGAAIAALCHEYVWFHRPELREKLRGYGFGTPRFYWGFLPRRVLKQRWEKFFLIRNRKDLVTHLPPVLLGFRHVHKVQTIGKKNSDSPIGAHRPESYLRELSRYGAESSMSGML